jgi:cell division protein FtsB
VSLRLAPGSRLSGGKRSPFTRRAAVFATVLFLVAVSVAYPAQRYVAQRQQIDELRADVAAGAARVGTLEQEQVRLGQDRYIEREARRRLHFVMPGDVAFRVEDPHIVAWQVPDAGPSAAPTSDVWWERLLGSLDAASARVEPLPSGTRPAPAGAPVGQTAVGR